MFEFTLDNTPPSHLEVEKAHITLFYHALTNSDQISLYVEVAAKAREIVVPEDGEGHDVYLAPRYYTEWLEIPLSALKSRGPDALDGYQMLYDKAREEELGFDQFPGAIYQDMHAGFTRATMQLKHLEQNRYVVSAQGGTEFGWAFKLKTEAALEHVILRDGYGEAKQPNPAIEAEFEGLFDAARFDSGWQKKGNAQYSWHDYVATPKGAK